MKKSVLVLAAAALMSVLSSCGTVNGVRWAYGHDSIYAKQEVVAEKGVARAIFGVPVIVGGATFDVLTWPVQLLFGVWPMWGRSSPILRPDGN
ncbi:MAG: hypothetical protein H6835_13030 [Planctomycetes bacterium]|nr:hypothetical protein [Planctomycetota bacterium]